VNNKNVKSKDIHARYKHWDKIYSHVTVCHQAVGLLMKAVKRRRCSAAWKVTSKSAKFRAETPALILGKFNDKFEILSRHTRDLFCLKFAMSVRKL